MLLDFPVGCRVLWTTSYPRCQHEGKVVGHTKCKVQIATALQAWPVVIYPCHLERVAPSIADQLRALPSVTG